MKRVWDSRSLLLKPLKCQRKRMNNGQNGMKIYMNSFLMSPYIRIYISYQKTHLLNIQQTLSLLRGMMILNLKYAPIRPTEHTIPRLERFRSFGGLPYSLLFSPNTCQDSRTKWQGCGIRRII